MEPVPGPKNIKKYAKFVFLGRFLGCPATPVGGSQNLCQNQENEGFKILDSGNPKFSRRRPTKPSRPVGFKQETTPKPSNNSKKMLVLARRAGLTQKLKVPKWVCRSPLAHIGSGPPFFAIFGPARGRIFWKKADRITHDGLGPFGAG